MTAPQRKRRPAGETAEAADQVYTRETGQYSQAKEKASSAKGRLTALKFRWMMQVASDHMLPPASTPIAVFMAAKFLHPETLEAWPSIPTLARLIGRSVTQTRTGLQALVKRGHLDAEITRGGKGNTSRYRPVILVPKPFGKPQGIDPTNPAENDRQTLRKTNAKPSGNPQGNPFNDTFDDYRRARSAPAGNNRSDSHNRDARKRASHDSVCEFNLNDHVAITGHGLCRVASIETDDRGQLSLLVYTATDEWTGLVVPLDREGKIMQNRVHWEDE